MEVPVLHLVCVDVLLDGLDHAVLILSAVHPVLMGEPVLHQTHVPVLHHGLELLVQLMSMNAVLV
jgi:hypothetical protein